MGFLTKKGIFDGGKVLFLPVEDISPNPDQPRRVFSQPELEELAASIRALGVLQPLTVRRREGQWELVAGERRLRAAKLAGLSQVPCLSVQVDSQSSSLLALVENVQRRDLDFWEEALALRQILDTYHLSQEELARRVGGRLAGGANMRGVLTRPDVALALLGAQGATARHARALLRLDSPERQLEAAEQVTARGLTVAQTEALVEQLLGDSPRRRKKPTFILKDVRLFLNTLSRSLELVRSAGVDARCRRQDTDDEILLTIRIPRRTG